MPYLIQGITSDPLQTMNIVLQDPGLPSNGTTVQMTVYFIPMQYGWFITSLTYQGFVLNGLRITNNLNMLRQWKDVIPFGLACASTQDREPSQQQDFSSGASNLYILSQSDVEAYEESLGNV